MLTVATFQTRPAWLASRRQSLGGSDAAVLAGVGFTSEYALFADKCGLAAVPDDDVPEYMEAGSFLEPGILSWWSHRTGLLCLPTPLTIIRNPAYPWAHASPDALVGDDAGVDAKSVDVSKAHEWDEGTPLSYQVQAQHYMAVADRARWHFGAAVGGRKLLCATVERDEGFIERLMERERAWWERHVVGREAPEPDGSEATARALAAAFRNVAPGAVIPLGEEAVELHERLVAASAIAAESKEEADACRNKLRAMVGDAELGVLPGGRGAYRRKVIEKKPYTVNPKPYVDFRHTEKEIRG